MESAQLVVVEDTEQVIPVPLSRVGIIFRALNGKKVMRLSML